MRMSPHGLLYLNVLSPVGGAVWGHLGSLDLLDENHHWEVGFVVSKSNPSQSMFPSSFFLPLRFLPLHPSCLLCMLHAWGSRPELSAYCSNSLICHLLPCCCPLMGSNALESSVHINSFFSEFPRSWHSTTVAED